MTLALRLAWIKGQKLQESAEGMAEVVAVVERYAEICPGIRIEVNWPAFIAGLTGQEPRPRVMEDGHVG